MTTIAQPGLLGDRAAVFYFDSSLKFNESEFMQ